MVVLCGPATRPRRCAGRGSPPGSEVPHWWFWWASSEVTVERGGTTSARVGTGGSEVGGAGEMVGSGPRGLIHVSLVSLPSATLTLSARAVSPQPRQRSGTLSLVPCSASWLTGKQVPDLALYSKVGKLPPEKPSL